MRFGGHYLPTYIPDLDGPVEVFYQHLFEQMETLDALGYDDVWVTEHHFHEYGGTISQPPTFLAAVARTTRRIHLGAAINVMPLHHPLQVAEQYAMVDVVSNGRLEFGVGRGNEPLEFERFGMSYDNTRERMLEGIEIIRQAWEEGTVSFKGDLWECRDVRVLPRPVQRPRPPIWVGASRSDESYRWAGEAGFNLLTLPYMYEPDWLLQRIGLYREALAERGRRPEDHHVLGKFHIYVADNGSAARQEAADYLDNYRSVSQASSPGRVRPAHSRAFDDQMARGEIIAGSPERCIEIIQRWHDLLGLTAISGTFHFGGMPQEQALTNIRRFAAEVMPAFRPVAVGMANPSV